MTNFVVSGLLRSYTDNSSNPALVMARQPLMGQDLLIIKTSRSKSHTPRSVGLLCASDRPDEKNSDNMNNTQQQTSMTLAGIEHEMPARERPQTHALDLAAAGIDTARASSK